MMRYGLPSSVRGERVRAAGSASNEGLVQVQGLGQTTLDYGPEVREGVREDE